MAGRIPQDFIDELISRVDIVGVIDPRVPLKKSGREYVACCPFHEEKTPSFTVSPTKQFFHCFGCGAHGTAIGFLMEYERLSFGEAVEELAARTGMIVPRGGDREEPAQRDSHQRLYDVLGQATRYYARQLREHPQAHRAIEYLKGRGLSGEIAVAFGIGFAPPGWDNLSIALGDSAGRELLAEAGLLASKDNRHYDRFRDRIMFPIRDTRGRVVAFGGRVLGEGTPKYLNSPETAVFQKRRELYGLHEVSQAVRQPKRLLVVEGYLDVVSLAQFGIRYAVATLGTSVTREHLERLFRTCSEVVFCFDGDRAGRKAAWRGLEQAMPLMREGRQLRFMFLPEGEDPDTVVRRIGQVDFEARIAESVPLSEFFFDYIRQDVDLSSLDGRARMVELTKPLLSNMASGVYRQLMVGRLADITGIEPTQLAALVWGKGEDTGRTARPRVRHTGFGRQAPSPVRHAIALLLQQPALAQHAGPANRLAELNAPGIGLLTEMLGLLQERPHLNGAALVEHWRGTEEGRQLMNLAQRTPLLAEDHDDLEEEFKGALEKLDRLRHQQRLEELSRKSLGSLSPEEKNELQRLLSRKGGTS